MAATAQLPGLMDSLAQHIQGDGASQRHPCKLPILQEERGTFSNDRYCSTAFRARLSTMCLHCSEEEVPSLSVHDATSPSQSTGPSIASCYHKVQTNQRARLERFRRDKGTWQHLIRSHHLLLLCEEEKGRAMRPIPRMLCANTHYPTGPRKARRLPRRVFPTSFAKCLSPPNRRPSQFA